MSWHQVSYTTFECPKNPSFPDGHIAKRPILYVEIISGNERLGCNAIVDSGADHCTFPLSYARRLGLDPRATAAINTAGVGDGAVPTFYWPVKIDFQGIATLDAYAAFTAGLESIGFGLLGQAGFFDRVKVVFDHHGGLFHLEMPDSGS